MLRPYKEFGVVRLSRGINCDGECVSGCRALCCHIISFFAKRRRTMTPNEFRKLALSFPDTEERGHMNHPDFRVAGKIFATLGYPDKSWGMVKLTPVEQEMLVEAEPAVFVPAKGAWGRQGSTTVNLKTAEKDVVRNALAAAWRLTAPAKLSEQFPTNAGTASAEQSHKKPAQAARRKSQRPAKRLKSNSKTGI
jgi:hypothetical protein